MCASVCMWCCPSVLHSRFYKCKLNWAKTKNNTLHAPFYNYFELVKFSSGNVQLGHLLRRTKTQLWHHSGKPLWRHSLHIYHNMFMLLFSITLVRKVNKWLDRMFVFLAKTTLWAFFFNEPDIFYMSNHWYCCTKLET